MLKEPIRKDRLRRNVEQDRLPAFQESARRDPGHPRQHGWIEEDTRDLEEIRFFCDRRSLGNLLRHGYDEIDRHLIWRIVQGDLRSLRDACRRALISLAES